MNYVKILIISNEKIVQNIYMCKNNEYKDFDSLKLCSRKIIYK